MEIISQIKDIASECAFSEFGALNPSALEYYPEVRKICEDNSCRNYAKTWACPPATGTLAECRERIGRYNDMLLLSKKYKLEDSFDFEGMKKGLLDFKETFDIFHQKIDNILSDYLILSHEGCIRCNKCTYPDAPCRFPHLLHHSLEGYGFIVSELAKNAGIRYNNGPGTVTYFGAILFNSK